jgi:hypothetical protein
MAAFHLAILLLIPFPFVQRCKDCERSPSGLIPSNPAAVKAFKWIHPCPSTGKSSGSCPGYVLGHAIPLACGGADMPKNMRWQTKAQARSQELTGCRKRILYPE